MAPAVENRLIAIVQVILGLGIAVLNAAQSFGWLQLSPSGRNISGWVTLLGLLILTSLAFRKPRNI